MDQFITKEFSTQSCIVHFRCTYLLRLAAREVVRHGRVDGTTVADFGRYCTMAAGVGAAGPQKLMVVIVVHARPRTACG